MITKFRSLEEAHAALWAREVDGSHWRQVAALWQLSAWLDPPRFAPGVQRFASIEDASRAREAAEVAAHEGLRGGSAADSVRPTIRRRT